jgi:DNA-binding transcriptional MerR regulator
VLIGEVARRSGVSARMLRHYDALGLVTPSGRTGGGYREYSDADLHRLFQVEGLRSLGMALAEIRGALDHPAATPASLIAELVDQTRRRIERDSDLLERLASIDGTRPPDWATLLRTIRLLRDLGSEHAALRQRAALRSGAGSPIPTGLLVEAYLREPDRNAAGALRWALVARPDAVERLRSTLAVDDPESRRRAVLALAAIPAAEVEPPLRHSLTDADADVRRYAAMALGSRGGTEAVPVLVDVVAAGTGDVEAAELLGSLAKDGDVRARVIAAFGAIMASAASSHGARHRVVQALAELEGPDVQAMLRRLTHDDSPEIARTARALLIPRRAAPVTRRARREGTDPA